MPKYPLELEDLRISLPPRREDYYFDILGVLEPSREVNDLLFTLTADALRLDTS